jgi:nucleotide-binding universal stress UspA family protein
MPEVCKVEVTKILAALDLSSYSENTFTYAVDLARRYGAELIILNVINDRGLEVMDRIQAEGYGPSRASYIQRIQEARQAELEKDYLPRAGEVPARLEFRVGAPYSEILDFIVEEGIDFVVLGTQGHGAVVGSLFGTNADKIYRRAQCPVLSVRGPEHCRIPE